MRTLLKDPLLAISWSLLTLFIGLMAVAAAAALAGMAAIPFVQDQVHKVMAENATVSAAQASWTIAAMCAAMIAVFASFGYFALLLRRIVGSVAEGDPFIPANAVRLRNMGWLAVAITFAVPALVAVANWVTIVLGQAIANDDQDFSGNGLLLALVMFVLARVFRKGTEMREDLEGTV